MSMRVIARSSSNRNSASALASSVLPTPVGPRNRKDPVGRSGSAMPARLRRTASETACTARCCPIRRLPSSSSIRSSLLVSASSSRPAGMPVHDEITSAMSSAPTSSLTMALSGGAASEAALSACSSRGTSAYISREAASKSPSRCARSASPRASSSCFFSSPTLLSPAFSCSQRPTRALSSSCRSASSWRSRSSRWTEASSVSFDRASSSIFIRSTLRWSWSISTGRESISMRSREAASSTRSMALSGRNLLVM